MAVCGAHLAAEFGKDIVDHHTYCSRPMAT